MTKQLVVTLNVPDGFTWAQAYECIGQNLPRYNEPLEIGGDTLWPDEDTDPEGNFPEGIGSWDVFEEVK